jgi:hypothetical protein
VAIAARPTAQPVAAVLPPPGDVDCGGNWPTLEAAADPVGAFTAATAKVSKEDEGGKEDPDEPATELAVTDPWGTFTVGSCQSRQRGSWRKNLTTSSNSSNKSFNHT